MNCIDAIEGTVKKMITEFHRVFLDGRKDDTEYIENIKTIIAGTDLFVQENPEITNDAELLRQVLYSFSKGLWLQNLENASLMDPGQKNKKSDPIDFGYYEYYYDHIYDHGSYPR